MDMIKNLAENYPESNKMQHLDLVLESGAANGSYHIGCLLYIKELERKNKLKIDRISGSSIGAIAGLYYLTDTLNDFIEDYKTLRECFKRHLNLNRLKTILRDKIKNLSNDDFEKVNQKLFIVFHDITQRQQILKSEFKNKDDLLHSILKSSHIPYITDETFLYRENDRCYFDGGIPHIFCNRESGEKNILYINICRVGKINGIFSVKKEKNNYGRLIEGALDAHEFFIYEKPTKFCSYVNNWHMLDYTTLRLKQLCFKILFYFVLISHYIGFYVFPYIANLYIIQLFSPIFLNYYRDFLLFYCL